MVVEVDDFKIARHFPANDADGIVVICKPCRNLACCREPFLVFLPFECGTLFFFSCGQDGKTGRKVIQCC